MAVFSKEKNYLKNGEEISIRSAEEKDAQDLLRLTKSVFAEEIYQLTASDEFNTSPENERVWIRQHRDEPLHIALVAAVNHQIVGLLDFSNGHRRRIAHTGEFGMSVAKNFRQRGVGTFLLQGLIQWARSTGQIEKINLSVHGDNQGALGLYKKLGFQVEGVRKKELKYSSERYVDSIQMALFL